MNIKRIVKKRLNRRKLSFDFNSKKNIAAILGTIFLSSFLVGVQLSQAFSGGSGTVPDPYLISTCVELQSVRTSTLSASYKLSSDIDCSATSGWNGGQGFIPIGTSGTPFTGTFDGNNKTISGLTIARSSSYAGLFGATSYATISGTNMTGVSIVAGSSNPYVGGLVGYANYTTITTSSVSGTVSGNYYVGVLAGMVYYGSITKSYSSGSATGAYMDIGGLAGAALWTTVSETYSTANATGPDTIGGLLGAFTGTNQYLTNSFARGSATATAGNAGGLTGDSNYIVIQNCYATGTVISTGGSGAGPGGGITGWYNHNSGAPGPFIDNFWDTQTSGISHGVNSWTITDIDGVTAKTTAQMKNVSTFTTIGSGLATAWDFASNPGNDSANNDYWDIDGVTNDGYPFLTAFVPPTIQFTTSSSSGNESTTSVNLGLTLSRIWNQDSTVSYAVTGGTATGSGTDYTLASGTATITAGSTTVNIPVTIVNDTTPEADETIIVTISSPTNSSLGSRTTHTYTIVDNDVITAQFGEASSSGSEATSPKIFGVTLSQASPSDVTIDYSVSGSATAVSDFTAPSGTLIITAGNTFGGISVPIINDSVHEPDETLVLTITDVVNATVGSNTSHTYTILNDDLPTVQLDEISSSGLEATSPKVFGLTLSATYASDVTIHYAITGSAENITDYTAPSGTVVITAGSTTGSISVPIIGDSTYESDETLILTLIDATNATLGTNTEHTYTILNDDVTVQLDATSSSGLESVTTKNFGLTLSAIYDSDVVVSYSLSGTATGGVDYTTPSGSVTIPAGETTVNIAITIADDSTYEADETLIVTLTSATNATLGTNTEHVYTILNEDAVTVGFDEATSRGSEATSPKTFGISLSAAYTSDITIEYSVSGSATPGVDFTTLPGSLTITAGSTTGSISIPITNDTEYEPDETIVLTLTSATGATLNSNTVHAYTIQNDVDVVSVELNETTSSGLESVTTKNFGLTLSLVSSADVTVTYSLSGSAIAGVDYTPPSGSITIVAGSTSGTISIPITNDTLYEPSETIALSLTGATNASLGNNSTNTYTILNDGDLVSIGLNETTSSGSEGTTTKNFELTLSTTYSSNVTVEYSLSGTAIGGVDYVVPSGTVTITAGSTTGNIPITITNDALKEADETLILTLHSPVNARLSVGYGYDIGSESSVYTINDNDSVGIGFAPSSHNAMSFSEGTGVAQIPVYLSSSAGTDITIHYGSAPGSATSGGGDYTLNTGILTILAGKTVGYIPATIVEDAIPENDELFTVTLSDSDYGTIDNDNNYAFITIKDNDAIPTVGFTTASGSVIEGSTATIPLTLSKAFTGSSVTLSLTGGTAVNGTNINLGEQTSGSVPFDHGATASIEIPTLVDSSAGNKTAILTLSSPINATLSNIIQYTLTIRKATVISTPPLFPSVNGTPSPSSVGSNNPIFAWEFNRGAVGDSQTAYQIVIASSEANMTSATYECDSGKITSTHSVADYTTICPDYTLSSGAHFWKVQTWNIADTASGYTSNQSLTKIDALAAPTACTISSIGNTSLTVSWTRNSTSEIGFQIEKSGIDGSRYDGTMRSLISDENYREIQTVPNGTESFDVTRLYPEGLYFFRVRALANDQASTYATCGITQLSPSVPATPNVVGLSDTSLYITVQPQFAKYAIQVNNTYYLQTNGTLRSGGSSPEEGDYLEAILGGAPILNPGVSERGMTITGLSPNTPYSINVFSENWNGIHGPTSSTAIGYTLAQQPTITTGNPSTSSFTATIGTASNPAGTLYAVRTYDGQTTKYVQADGSLALGIVKQTAATWGTVTITGLTADSPYHIQSIAYNAEDIEIYSSVTEQITTGSTASTIPTSECSGTAAPVSIETIGYHEARTTTIRIFPGLTDPVGTEYMIQDVQTNTYATPSGILISTPTWDTFSNYLAGGIIDLPITGLEPNSSHIFRIKAKNCTNNETAFTTNTHISTTGSETPNPPIVTAIGDTDGRSAIKVVIDVTGTGMNTGNYALYDATTNQYFLPSTGVFSATFTEEMLSGSSNNTYDKWGYSDGLIIRNITPGVTHAFALRTADSGGSMSGLSSLTTITTLPDQPKIGRYEPTTYTVRFQVNPMENSTAIQYAIEKVPGEYLQAGGSNNTFSSEKSWETIDEWDRDGDRVVDGIITIGGLQPNTQHPIRLIPRNSENAEGINSMMIPLYTLALNPNSPAIQNTSSTSLTFSWNGRAGMEYRIEETRLHKYVASGALTDVSSWSTFADLDENTATISGLTTDTEYCFAVVGRNGDGVITDPTTEICGTPTSEIPALVAPTRPYVSIAGLTSLTFSWYGGTNPAGTEYQVTETRLNKYVASGALTDTSSWSTFADTAMNRTAIDGLTTGTQYCFSVKARRDGTETAATTEVCETPQQTGGTYTDPCISNPSSAECTTQRCAADPTLSICGPVIDTRSACMIDPNSAACTTERCAADPTLSICGPTVDRRTICERDPSSQACTDIRCAADPTLSICPPRTACAIDPGSPSCTTERCAADPTLSICGPTVDRRTICERDPSSQACTDIRCAADPTLSICPRVDVCTIDPNSAACIARKCAAAPTLAICKPVVDTGDTRDTGDTGTGDTGTGDTGTAGGDTGGTGDLITSDQFKKQLEDFKKQQDTGEVTFQIGDIKKNINVKAEKGITREEFIAAIITDLDLKKVYKSIIDAGPDANNTDPTAIAQKLNILSPLLDAKGIYDKTKYLTNQEAFNTILMAINTTQSEACRLKIFDFCTITDPSGQLTKKISDSIFKSAKAHLNLQNQLKSKSADIDKDKLKDWEEVNLYGTDPKKADTDGDGLSDGDEVLKYKTDPTDTDTDRDGLSDGDEVLKYKTDPLKPDTDDDGFNDKMEIDKKTDPLSPLSFPRDIKVANSTEDYDRDGLSDKYEMEIGTDPHNPDTDGDGLIDSADSEPLVFNIRGERTKLLITNLRSGMRSSTTPFIKGSAPANTMISVIAKNEFGLKREIAHVQASENNLFAAEPKALPNGTFFIEVQDETGETSPQVKIIIDSSLKVDPPGLESIDGISFKEGEIPNVSSSPTIKMRVSNGGRGIVTFRSAIGTAILISDTSEGTYEIRPPEELQLGEHEIIAYTVKEDENIVSSTVKFKFNVTGSSNLSAAEFRIKNASTGGVVSFLRQKTVKPLFEKIAYGVGGIILIWLLISGYQSKREKLKRRR